MTDTQTTGRHVAAHAIDTSIIGAVLGAYRITSVISSGGMGSVYRAQHELLDRPAAIKLLRPELTENIELVQRFFTEAKAATAIRHPGIVEVYDFGYTDDGQAYLVMEFLDGAPLSRVIADRGRFPELEAASLARSIASALKAAHAKGIIHRDLKPDNVFIVPDPDGREARVKVLDFGIAKLANQAPNTDRRRTQTGVLMGTPKYMAPEQAREAAAIDHRADLYSLGCILYELLVGQPPFVAEGAGEIIALQLFTEPEPPGKLVPISHDMEHVVLKLLAKEPTERFQSASEVMDALVAIGARMSGPADAISVDSKNNIRVSQLTRDKLSKSDTIPAIASPEITAVDPAPTPRPVSKKLPFMMVGLALMTVGAVIAYFLSRPSDAPAAPAQQPPAPVVTQPPPPTVVEPPPTVPPTPPPVVEEKPVVVKTGTKGKKTKVETQKTDEKPKDEKLKSPDGSPINTDVGEIKKPPKVP